MLSYIQASLKTFTDANLYQNLQTRHLVLVALKIQTGITKLSITGDIKNYF